MEKIILIDNPETETLTLSLFRDDGTPRITYPIKSAELDAGRLKVAVEGGYDYYSLTNYDIFWRITKDEV
jgi:hypothetical protein